MPMYGTVLPPEDQAYMDSLNLPVIPDEYDGEDESVKLVTLVLFRRDSHNIPFRDNITYRDARQFCEHPGTQGEGWFVGWWWM